MRILVTVASRQCDIVEVGAAIANTLKRAHFEVEHPSATLLG